MWFHLLTRPLSNSTRASRIHTFPLARSCQTLRSPRIFQLSRRLQAHGFRRLKSTTRFQYPPPPKPKQSDQKSKYSYPERLLIYHAGTGKTVFIGCLKVTTIFIFSYFLFTAVPAQFRDPAEPNWTAAFVLLCGMTPLLFIAYTTSPFVAFIHLRLPAYARSSQQLLRRYAATLPPTAEIDITTMNVIGRQRISRVKISDLYPKKSRFGIANLGRRLPKNESPETKSDWWGMRDMWRTKDPLEKKRFPWKKYLAGKKYWFVPNPPTCFAVGTGSGVVREKAVWGDVERVLLQQAKIVPPRKEPKKVKSKWD